MASQTLTQARFLRQRFFYALLLLLLVLMGLPTRSDVLPLPQPVLKYGGGFLWALAIYVSLAFIFNTASIRRIWLLAVLITCGIEISQLYRTEGLDAFRWTLLGRLTIGSGFLWADVLSYLAGVTLAAGIETFVAQRYQETDHR